MRSCVHAKGKNAFNGLFSRNINFNEDLPLQFSGILIPAFLNGGCSRVNKIAGSIFPEVRERECSLRKGFTAYGSCDDPFKLSIMI